MDKYVNATNLIQYCKNRIAICDKRIKDRQEKNSIYDFSDSIEHISCTALEYEKCIALLESACSANVETVFHAHWIKYYEKHHEYYYCSRCLFPINGNGKENRNLYENFEPYKRCPYCGSYIDEDKDNG
jgi:uncharacterized protein with PIN domain